MSLHPAREDGALWILGGEAGVAAAVELAASKAGGWRVRRVADEDAEPTPGDAVVDLGVPPVRWDREVVARVGGTTTGQQEHQ